jgi:hypothetical protein
MRLHISPHCRSFFVLSKPFHLIYFPFFLSFLLHLSPCSHCTYGFNRTGFTVCCYLVQHLRMCVEDALAAFAEVRRQQGPEGQLATI